MKTVNALTIDAFRHERADIETYLQGRPPCDCGECLDCRLRAEIGIVDASTGDASPQKIQSPKGENQMSTKNQQISENFVHGDKYLAEWNRSADLRQEFGNDFEAYAHYQSAYSNGQVKTMGGVE